MALALLFILTLFASALMYLSAQSTVYLAKANRENLREQSVEMARYQVLESLASSSPVPSPTPTISEIEVSPQDVSYFRMKGRTIVAPLPSQAGMDPNNVPTVGYSYDSGSGTIGAICPWQCQTTLTDVMTKDTYNAVYIGAFPYGVYAPAGTITLDSARGYSNPTIKEMMTNLWDVNRELSAIPVLVQAGSDVIITSFPYGKAYTESGKVTIANNDGGVGFVRPVYKLNNQTYADVYTGQIESAFTAIKSQAVDKTEFLLGMPLDLGTFFNILVNGSSVSQLKSIFSLQQAMQFPFFTWISMADYGIVYEIYFHIADAPDDASVNNDDASAYSRDKNLMKQVGDMWQNINVDYVSDPYDNQTLYQAQVAFTKALSDKLSDSGLPDDDSDKIKELQARFKNSYYQDPTTKDFVIHKTDPKPLENYDIVGLRADEEGYSRYLSDYWEHKRGSVKPGKITFDINGSTLEQEKDFLGSDDDSQGASGYNYGKMIHNAWGFFKNIITFHPKDAMESMMGKIRVVHFEGGAPDFQVSGNDVTFTSDWTVPKGRTLNLDGDYTINGDVWIQDGATLYVDGSLTVTNPNPSTDGGGTNQESFLQELEEGVEGIFKPRGRVFLGRGSNLIVEGDFTCDGTSYMGSVIVDSELNQIPAVTSSILCHGNVTLPHGIFPGLSPDSIGNLANRNNVPALGPILKDLVYVPSQIAKVFGPFEKRLCCFERWPDPWSIIEIDIFGIPITLLFPDPLDRSRMNVNIGIFRTVTEIYPVVLNATLGENLFTDTSWWALGQGAVPIIPKVGGTQLLENLQTYFGMLQALPGEIMEKLKSLLTVMNIEHIVEGLMIKVLQQIGLDMINNWVSEIPFDPIKNKLDQLFDGGWNKLMGNLDAFTGAYDPTIYVKNFEKSLQNFINDLKSQMENFRFYETSGVLVYASKNISIGDANNLKDCPHAAGLFVAGGNVECYAELTIGCIISQNGNIATKDFYYYPYFTRASLNAPASKSIWMEVLDPLIYSSSSNPQEIGVTIYNNTAEGWSKQ